MVKDIPHNHDSGYLPILDTQMAVCEGKFTFKHYTKPMASVEVTLERASMSMAAKLNILTAEGSRRLRNCDLETPWNQQVEYLNKLMVSMMWGGYTPKIREIVARRVLAKYTNNLRNFREQGRPLYRSKYERNQVMKPDKTNWFRKEGATATLTVPCTKKFPFSKRFKENTGRYRSKRDTSKDN